VTLARVPTPPEGSIQGAVPRSRGRLGGEPMSSSGAAPVILVLVLLAVGAAGALIGVSGRHSEKDAANARRAAEQQAFATAERDLVARGRRDGLRAGTSAGTSAGRAAGRRAGATRARASAAPAPGQIKDCPKTPVRKNSVVSSVKGISCDAAAAEQRAALKSGHPNRTAKGFTCQRIDPKHYRCVKGSQAYRWDITQ
jgi:hypothetical protein